MVTSIDAKVQSVVEQPAQGCDHDGPQDGRPGDRAGKYVADSGSAIVLNATNGRLVAMASYPTYNPDIWVGGITQKNLDTLYSKSANMPLLNRADQGLYAPGSTFKPFNTAGALMNGFSPSTELDCSSSFQVGDRTFKNYESEAYGNITFAKALQVSCDTFFYRVGYTEWLRSGGNASDVHADDPLVDNAKMFGFGRQTGIDIPGEVAGRIADRKWKLAYWKANKAYYCNLGKSPQTDFLHVFAREFCIDGWQYRAGDAVNFAIGQGDTLLTPLQLAVAYGALANGGTLWEPRLAEAVVSPDGKVVKRIQPQVASKVTVPPSVLHYIDTALLGTAKTGTMAWKMIGFPLGQGADPEQDRHRRGLRQADHLVGRHLRQAVRRAHADLPRRHRLGHLGRCGPQDLGVAVRDPRRDGGPGQGRPAGREAADGRSARGSLPRPAGQQWRPGRHTVREPDGASPRPSTTPGRRGGST